MALTIEDQLAGVAEGVGDLDEEWASLSGEGLSRRPAGAGEKEEVLRARLADGVHDELHGVDPGRDVGNIVRLVHDTAMWL